MKLKLLLFLTVAVLGFGFMRPSEVVQAQEPEPICTPSFCGESLPIHNWVNAGNCTPTRNADGTWESCVHQNAGNRWAQLNVQYQFPVAQIGHQDITNLTFNYSGPVSVATVGFYYCAVQQDGCHTVNIRSIWYNSNDYPDLSTRGLSQERVYRIIILLESEPCGVYVCSAESLHRILKLSNVRFCSSSDMFCEEEPEYYRPLKSSSNAGIVSNPRNSSATNFFSTSNNQHATVHAATDGIITIERLTTDDCRANNLFGDGAFGDSELCYFDGVNSFRAPHLTLNIVTAKVMLDGDDGSQWEYWVHSPFLYSTVRSGQFVKGGCPIGGTIATGNQGVTIVFERGGDADVDYMNIEPTGSDCAPELNYDGCITQISPNDWEISGGVIEHYNNLATVRFETVGTLKTLLNVPMDRSPKLRLYVYSPADARLAVVFGENIRETVSINASSTFSHSSIDIDLDGAFPDRDPFYSLEIGLLQPSRQVYIGSICLFLDNSPPREYCYFLNNDFTNGLSEWDRSSSSVVPRSNNAVFIPDEGSIWQNLKLVTGQYDDDLEFNVRVNWGVFDYSNNIFVDEHYLISLEYKWGGYTNDLFQEIGIATRDIVADTNNNLITSFNLLISQNIEADFELRIIHSELAPPPATLNAEIRSICLTGDVWAEDKPVPPFNASCPLGVTRPTGSDIGLWIGYLWSELSRFFTCDLMRVLNAIHTSLIDFFDTSRYFMRYLMVSGNMTLSWFSTDILYWINGHLSNIAGGNVTFIEVQGGKSCNNLFCVIDGFFGGFNNLLNFLGQLLDQALAPIIDLLIMIVGDSFSFLLGLAQSVIELLLTGAYAIIDLGKFFFSFLWKILNDFSTAEPVQIPMLPYCDVDPNSSPACRLFWVAEHTIFSGPGAIIIPIFTGYLIVIIMLYMIKETKKAIIESGKLI
jgi:hypothetical protein